MGVQCMISKNNEQYQAVFRAKVCLSLFSSKQCVIKLLINSVFLYPEYLRSQ